MRTYPTWRLRIPRVFSKSSQDPFNQWNLKFWGKGRIWGLNITFTNYETICTHNIKSCEKGNFIKVCYFPFKILMHIEEPVQVNLTYPLSQYHIHQKSNTSKPSQVHMHINTLDHIVKATLSQAITSTSIY